MFLKSFLFIACSELLLLSIIGGGWEDPSELLFKGVLLSLGILLGGLIWASAVEPKPQEIIISTMEKHQRYFPIFDSRERLTNNFFVVANKKD